MDAYLVINLLKYTKQYSVFTFSLQTKMTFKSEFVFGGKYTIPWIFILMVSNMIIKHKRILCAFDNKMFYNKILAIYHMNAVLNHIEIDKHVLFKKYFVRIRFY
jgi:hypothetical protein